MLALSRVQFGAASYQADWRYFDWLYLANPAGRGFADCILAVQDDKPVGLIHRMNLPATQAGNPRTVVSLQNHFMAAEARSGAGLLLLNRATRGDVTAFSPGVQGRLAQAYRRLGYREVAGFWLTRPLNLPGIAINMLLARISPRTTFDVALDKARRRHPNLELGPEPDSHAVTALTKLMNAHRLGEEALCVDWSPDLVAWRYFSADGPRHLLVRCPRSGAIAVLAFGLRKGVKVVRIMECFDAGDTGFVKRLLAVARAAGASFALAFTMDAKLSQAFAAQGFRLRENDTASFVSTDGTVAFGPAETDVGFEAFQSSYA